MNKWLLWLALCTGTLACGVEPIAPSSDDEGGDDEADEGSNDDDSSHGDDHGGRLDGGAKSTMDYTLSLHDDLANRKSVV